MVSACSLLEKCAHASAGAGASCASGRINSRLQATRRALLQPPIQPRASNQVPRPLVHHDTIDACSLPIVATHHHKNNKFEGEDFAFF